MQQIPLLLLFAISLLGYIYFFHHLFKWNTEVVPVVVIACQILCLYLAGLFNFLPVMTIILVVVGLIALPWVLFVNRKHIGGFLLNSFTPGFVLFWVLFGLFWLMSRKLQFTQWDEFSHWGTIYRLVTQTNQLPGRENGLIFSDYPPGTVLFEYFLARLIGRTEGTAYFANDIMILAPMIAMLSGQKWRKWYLAVVTFLSAFLIFHFFGYSFTSLYIDGLLGIYFGIGVVFVFWKTDHKFISSLPILLICCVMPLIKQAGLYFGLSIAAVYVVQTLYPIIQSTIQNHRNQAETSTRRSIAQFWDLSKVTLLMTVIISLSPLLMNGTWNLHMRAYGFHNTFSAKLDPKEVVDSFSVHATPRARTTIASFYNGVDTIPIGPGNFSTKQLMVIFSTIALLLLVWIQKSQPELAPIHVASQFTLIGCILFYLFGLLLAYMFSFTEYEGTRIASFSRYSGSAMLGWAIALLGVILSIRPQLTQVYSRYSSFIVISIVALYCLLRIPNSSLNYFVTPTIPPERDQIVDIYREFNSKIEPDAKIYDLWQNTQGFLHYVTRYEFSPHIFEFWGWTIGKPYYEGDIWTVNYTPVEWMTLLNEQDFDYVLVGVSDEPFWQTYGSLFVDYEPENRPQLFRVTQDHLIRVP